MQSPSVTQYYCLAGLLVAPRSCYLPGNHSLFLVGHDGTKHTTSMRIKACTNHYPWMQTLAAGFTRQPQAKPHSIWIQDFSELWAPSCHSVVCSVHRGNHCFRTTVLMPILCLLLSKTSGSMVPSGYDILTSRHAPAVPLWSPSQYAQLKLYVMHATSNGLGMQQIRPNSKWH